MKQLTGLDASFLYMETPTTFGHVSGLSIFHRPDDPDFVPYDAVRHQIESRLHLLEPFRRRVVEVPLGLDHPWWVNDGDFDLEFHLRHIAIPPPGDNQQLAAQVARIISRPLDRARPLWEAYVFEGLPNDDFAVLTKFHHATIDGASGVEFLTMLLDADPDGDEVPPDDGSWRPDRIPSGVELLNRTAFSLVSQPARLARFQINTARHLARLTRNKGLENTIETVRKALPAPIGPSREARRNDLHLPAAVAPPTPFNASISAHRRLALGSAPLADIKALKDALGVTVNDVVMAVVAGALRTYLIEHDALPDAPLQAMVPVSIRTGEEADRWTNRVSSLVVSLPTDIEDPLERVEVMHQIMDEAKDNFEMVPAEALVDLAQFSSPAVAAQAARTASAMRIADRTRPPVNVVVSNVPGPRQPLYLGGAMLRRYYPVSTISDGIGLNITVHSYLDGLDVGLVAARELAPDLDHLLALHATELDTLFAAVGAERPSQAPPPKPRPKAKRKAKAATSS